MKKQIINAKKAQRLFTPNKPGLGIVYEDKRFGKKYDIGMCRTSRGICLITCGLNLSRSDIVPKTIYVQTGRDCHEVILAELGRGRI